MNKVCVTGNRGFIGKNLQNELERLGYIVIGIEKWIMEKDNWETQLAEYLSGIKPQAVFHVGALTDTQCTNVEEMTRLNVQSTMVISDWCKSNNIPMIYSSSASIYGTRGLPETKYAYTKYFGELFAVQSGAIALRYFNVYGMGEENKGKMASVAYQAYLCNWMGETMKLFPIEVTRDFVYVKDVVAANIHAFEYFEHLEKKAYEVGSGKSEPFERVMEYMNLPYIYTDINDIPKCYQDFTEAKPENFMDGWLPQFNLEKGVKEYLKLLRENFIVY